MYDDKSEYFDDNKALGNKAENLVVTFFEEANFKVIRYGYEYTVPDLCKRYEKKIQGTAAEYIRHMPDLVVVNRDNEVFFIEVKYRSKDEIKDKDLFNYPCSYVVLIGTKGILGQEVKLLYDKGDQSLLELNKLQPFKEIKDELIQKYDKKVRRMFGDETWLGQMWDYNIKNKEPPKKTAYFKKDQTPCENCGNLKSSKYKWCEKCNNLREYSHKSDIQKDHEEFEFIEELMKEDK